MNVMEAIYSRRAVREYSDQAIDRSTVAKLIQAAVQAPSAINMQPWAFAVIHDKAILKRYSDRAKRSFTKSAEFASLPGELQQMLSDPNFNIFYNAGTLIAIYAKPIGEHPDWDCCLAGQNLMLAACDMGLGTCPIGFAWDLLGEPDIRRELSIPEGYKPVLPIIVGNPKHSTAAVSRHEPEIACWL